MSRTGFAYAQARLHARLAGRLSEADWQKLEASRDLAHCLDAAAATQARAFSERLDRNSPPHAIERVTREVWLGGIAEICNWLPDAWRGATQWLAALPYLRRIEVAEGNKGRPDWLMPELEFGQIWPEITETTQARSVSQRWLAGWQGRFPAGSMRRDAQDALAPLLSRYLGRNVVPPALSSDDLSGQLIELFRRRAQTPVAIFAYVLLMALDAERLRGILVNRSLFPGGP
jgi:hypothetical protein